ncbi:hypothetical protein JOF53_006526 [Crossiella equi]|uniref:Uncharacterized protein n=1 Tax=Crossiella equi TaxID=130796 RepID=A0ABS5AN89_9PSEU|nr:hypothetical protein [Crossiella equi]
MAAGRDLAIVLTLARNLSGPDHFKIAYVLETGTLPMPREPQVVRGPRHGGVQACSVVRVWVRTSKAPTEAIEAVLTEIHPALSPHVRLEHSEFTELPAA